MTLRLDDIADPFWKESYLTKNHPTSPAVLAIGYSLRVIKAGRSIEHEGQGVGGATSAAARAPIAARAGAAGGARAGR